MEHQRLPTDVAPCHYSISLSNLCFEAPFSYEGSVHITLSVNRPTDSVWLNSKELDIRGATVTSDADPSETTASHVLYDKELERVKIQFPTTIRGPRAEIAIQFKGTVNNALCGFYRTSTQSRASPDVENTSPESSYVFSTQFESCEARRAFPCFDEPNLKATFELHIQAPENLTVLSNMPQRRVSKTENGSSVTSFEKTPIMSTYLLGWAIGDFEYIEAFTRREYNGKRLPVRVYTQKGLISQAKYALGHACRVMDYFSEIFKVDYPLPKVDLVAIPEFAHGAMENWGLCTFQTTALLFDQKTSTLDNHERASYVIGHELAHQWFGNLVTMDWWNDLWLKEGFATWAGWHVVDHFHPDWKVWERFISEGMQTALQLDALRSSHPIDVQVKNGPDIDAIFDDISYLKGSSLVRMLDSYLGREVFLQGVANYLNAFAYQNATSKDLWKHLSESSGKDVNSFMDGWIQQMGFPTVGVDLESNQAVIIQERFLLTNDLNPEEAVATWWIPMRLSNETGDGFCELRAASTHFELDTPESNIGTIVRLNQNQSGFYKVNFSSNILAQLSTKELPTGVKIALIADLTAFVVAGKRQVIELLDVIETCHGEREFFTWFQISRALDILTSVFSGSARLSQGLCSFKTQLLEEISSTVVWGGAPGEGHVTTRMRALIIKMQGLAGHEDTVAKALRQFDGYLSGASQPDGSLLPTILSVSCAKGGLSTYNSLKAHYLEAPSTSIDLKETCLRALGTTSSPEALEDYLSFLLSPETLVSDLHIAATTLATTSSARVALWEWLQEHWDEFLLKIDGSWVTLDRFLKNGLGRFSEDGIEDQVKAFFRDRDCGKFGFERGLEIVLERISINATLRRREEGNLEDWLERRGHLEAL